MGKSTPDIPEDLGKKGWGRKVFRKPYTLKLRKRKFSTLKLSDSGKTIPRHAPSPFERPLDFSLGS